MKSDFEWQSADGGCTPQESTETILPRIKNLSRPVHCSLAIGDSKAQTVRELCECITPFWLDQKHFGCAFFKEEDGYPEVVMVVDTSGDAQPIKWLSSRDLVVAVIYDFQRFIRHNYASCGQAAWVND